jgi:hypothetical protein
VANQNPSSVTGDAIDKIAELVRKAEKPPFVQRPGDAEGVICVLNSDGTYRVDESVRGPTLVRVPTPDALIDYVKKHLKDNGEIYVSENSATLIMDAVEYKGDQCDCVLKHSDQFKTLARWHEEPEAMGQAELIRILRTTFHGCVPASVVTLFRTLELKSINDLKTHQGHGIESLGKSMTAKVTGTAELPDDITFVVPIWENWRISREVRCVLDVDPRLMEFKLIPVASEIERAKEAVELELCAYLRKELKDNTDAIYRGTFSA